MSDATTGEVASARRRGSRKEGKARTGSSPEAQGAAAVNRRDIPLSAYDFLEGAYRATARARLVLVGVSAVLLAAGALVAFQGVQASLAASTVTADLDAIGTERAQLLKEFGTLTGFEGVSERDLIARDQELSVLIKNLVATSPDFVSVLAQVKDTAEALGMTVTSIEVTPVDLPDKKKEEGSDEEESTQVPQSVYRVEVTVTGGDFNSIVNLAELLQSTGALKEVTISNSSSSSLVSGLYVAGRPSAAVEALLSELQIATRPAPPPTPGEDPASGGGPAVPGSDPASSDPAASQDPAAPVSPSGAAP